MTVRNLYQGFRGNAPARSVRTGLKFGKRWLTRKGAANILVPNELVVVGHVNAIEYDTVRDGRTVKARHVFAPGSRPVFMVGDEPGQLFLVGTRYTFTDRGIVDQDGEGRSIDYHEDTNKIKYLK